MRFELTYRLKDDFSPPHFIGSMLRGEFGNMFKNEVCVRKDRDCKMCILKERCPYLYAFETPIPQGADIMRKYTSAPHPFVIEPPEKLENILKKGEKLSFGLILIGKAMEYLPYFVYTFIRMGNRGIGMGRIRASLQSVKNGSEELFSPNERTLKDGKDVKSVELIPSKGNRKYMVRLSFPLPVSIKKDGKIARTIEFETLMRSFFRRIVLLEYFHNRGSGEYPFKKLLERLSDVKIADIKLHYKKIPRFSTRQNRRMFLEGVVGFVEYEKVPEVFIPYIKAMEDLHVGKNTSFGLGKVNVYYERI